MIKLSARTFMLSRSEDKRRLTTGIEVHNRHRFKELIHLNVVQEWEIVTLFRRQCKGPPSFYACFCVAHLFHAMAPSTTPASTQLSVLQSQHAPCTSSMLSTQNEEYIETLNQSWAECSKHFGNCLWFEEKEAYTVAFSTRLLPPVPW